MRGFLPAPWALVSAVLVVLTGCTAVKAVMPQERASRVDFAEMYTKSLAEKYEGPKLDNGSQGPSMLAQKLREYDTLPLERARLLDMEEARSTSARAEIRTAIAQMDQRANALQTDLNRLKRDRIQIESHQKSLTRMRTLLPKKFKEAALAKEEEEIDGRSEVQAHELAIVVADMELRQQELTQQQTLLVELNGKLNKLLLVDPVEDRRRQIRDEIVKDFMAMANANYFTFKNALLAGRVQSDTIADISELLLSTATTLVGGVTSKGNLGAASTLLKGSRSTVDKNFFAQQSMRAIINAMEDGRQKDEYDILKRLDKPTSEYPLSQAMSDLQRFESRSDLFSAVLDIANQTGKNADSSAEALRTK